MRSQAMVGSYPHARAGHCGSGALRSLLEHHGLDYGSGPLSEGFVFGLSGGFGFYFLEMPGMKPPLYLVGRTGDLEKDFCRHLGVDLDLRQTDDPGEGWEMLREALDRGEPTMVWADIKHLDYLRVRMHNTMHDIVVTGYDEAEGVAFVADNDRDEIQRCSLESLARARNSNAFPAPNRHATWLMRFPDRLPPLEMAVRHSIERAVTNMRTGGQTVAGFPGAVGLDGAEEFARSYSSWPELFGDDLADALRGLNVFIVKAGTGGAMFRSLQAQFLEEVAALLGDRALAAAGATYRQLADDWVALAGACRDDEPQAGHRRGAMLVADITAGERAGLEQLERWLTCG